MVRKLLLSLCCLAGMACSGTLLAQTRLDAADFKEECDSLTALLEKRTQVRSVVRIKQLSANGMLLNFSFTEHIGDWRWTREDIRWFRKELKARLPEKYKDYSIGELKCRKLDLNRYVTPVRNDNGRPAETAYRVRDHRSEVKPLVTRVESESYDKGLSGRHIALWQSHGRYFEEKLDRWEWQRATIFETVEDLYTQSYVLPFLVPMLENAGAVVMLPRERDFSRIERLADNDPALDGSCDSYIEKGDWSDAGTGFRNAKSEYTGTDNPFRMGSARKAAQKAGSEASASWSVDMPERGSYAVYISYTTLENSTDCASYTVHHLGGDTHFRVNQQMGGGMWVYLGDFELPEGRSTVVTLDCGVPEGCSSKGKSVSADAVKVGGGMGNIARSSSGSGNAPVCSGMPRFTEGARYWLQWSGFDEKVWNLNEQKSDYRDDFMCRGPWVQHLSGGSRINPKEEGKHIPVDLSFAFHTDAGTRLGDTIVGTLAIYTLLKENSREYTDGSDRMAAREYTELVQGQIVDDIRAGFEPQWSRRQLWDRSYSESRMPNVPAMLLELLSHQNFADMKYGLDPAFRFTVSRSIYKGMLKFLSNRYGCSYVVQPLPVNSFSASFLRDSDGELAMDGEGRFRMCLKWKDTPDSLEETAVADHYILYTRKDDGGWDNGRRIDCSWDGDFRSCETAIEPGSIYSWKVEACNAGGRSFPSRTMSAGIPLQAISSDGKSLTSTAVLAVDNFDRVASPTWYDSYEYAGFDNRQDGGIGYMYDCAYIGDMYEWHRHLPWMDDDCPGFGGSYTDWADRIVAGNTMDWSARHGKLIFDCGYAFCSASSDAFAATPELAEGIYALDLICGKQVSSYSGAGRFPARHTVFPEGLQEAIRKYCGRGGNLLVSGAYIATDAWGGIYPFRQDSLSAVKAREFCMEVLGYKWLSNYASRSCEARGCWLSYMPEKIACRRNPCEEGYGIESPDGIVPADSRGISIMRYSDSNVSAGVIFRNRAYSCLSLGFPIETIDDEKQAAALMKASIELILNK